jgi:ankyrin repeat protein/L-ascorbate metabolism protein UlaG (beta-lactamase superfamily)
LRPVAEYNFHGGQEMIRVLLSFVLISILTVVLPASEIHDAGAVGNLAGVKKLLNENPELLEARDNAGKTPLHRAAYNGFMDVTKFLLEKGADLNARTSSNSTPLHGAAYYGRNEVVRYLISNNADINAANDYNYTPLLSASSGGHLEMVKMLIKAGADIKARNHQNADALLCAASSGNAELVDYLAGLDLDMNTRDIDGETILHYAAYGGNIDLMKKSIQLGIDVNCRSNHDVIPIHYAAYGCHKEAVRYLLKNGAYINAKSDEGETPLHRAVFAAYEDTTDRPLKVIELLVENGASLNKTDNAGTTSLLNAIHTDNELLIKFLIDKGADINIGDNDGTTPLTRAIIEGNTKLVDLLLKNGARTDIRECHGGAAALHMASIKGNKDIIELLLPKVADINAQDDGGCTALYYAEKYGHKKAASILKARGATAKSLDRNYNCARLLSMPLKEEEAVLWYLGHCGWAIKTKNHLLVFDYWERESKPTECCLANGHIKPAEIADFNVTVFVTHEHRDHYDSAIFAWEKSLDNLTYIFGFQPDELSPGGQNAITLRSYECIGPRQHKIIDGMDIKTIAANDAGVGFLVAVDGLTIFHAGDHAGWREGERQGFTDEIDYLADLVDEVDLAFLNVTGCHVRDTIALEQSICYTVEKLSPRITIPTHGIDREHVYKKYAEKIARKKYKTQVLAAEHRGDRYIYRDEHIM